MPVRLRATKRWDAHVRVASLFDFCRVRSVSRISARRQASRVRNSPLWSVSSQALPKGFQMMCCRQVTRQASMSSRHP